MGKAIEYVVVILLFIAAVWWLAYVTYAKVHALRRKEQKQDEMEKHIKWD